MNFSSHCSQIYCLALQFFTKSFDVYIEFSFHFHFHFLRQRHILSTFCSIIKLCINKDNPLVPLQSATPIYFFQMRKSLMSGLNSRLVGFYQANGFLFTPGLNKVFRVINVTRLPSALNVPRQPTTAHQMHFSATTSSK